MERVDVFEGNSTGSCVFALSAGDRTDVRELPRSALLVESRLRDEGLLA